MKAILMKDTLSPALFRMLSRVRDRASLMMAIGQRARDMAVEAFTDPSKRVAPWPAKKDGSAATLYYRGVLKQSLRLIGFDNDSATVGSDRPYAAIHQLGGRTSPHVIKPSEAMALHFRVGPKSYYATQVNHPGSVIPARPYFPIDAQGNLHPEMKADAADMVRQHLELSR